MQFPNDALSPANAAPQQLVDRFGRSIDYLRVSVTDRCDLRCSYCIPKGFRDFEEPENWLTFDEVTRVVAAFARLGTSRFRLTGGEPLLRRNLPDLARRISALPNVEDLSLTTNGTQLALLRQSGRFDQLRRLGADPVRVELLPRAVAGVFACITLAALSCVVALVLAYLGVYGFSLAGLPSYTRMFGQVFAPAVTLVFVIKTLLFSLAVALIPMAAGLHDTGERAQPDSELGGLARMFAVLLLIEVGSLVGNYY